MDTAIAMARGPDSIAQLIAQAALTLDAAGVGTPRLDAELLLAAACGLDRTALYMRGSEPAPRGSVETFRGFLARRQRREPLQYIVGRQEFWSLEFTVTPAVLIPRPETELLVELALEVLRPVLSVGTNARHLGVSPPTLGSDEGVSKLAGRASGRSNRPAELQQSPPTGLQTQIREGGEPLQWASSDSAGEFIPRPRHDMPVATYSPRQICDVGTGSGCIAVALAHELPNADVWALDLSTPALAVAELNAQRLGVSERVRCLRSDLFAAVAHQRFSIIVANPPYLGGDDFADLQPELAYEPQAALDGGGDGLSVVRRLLAAAPDRLVEAGWLLMEIGCEQAAAVERLARAAGFKTISIRSDYAGLPRVLMARR